MSALMASCSLAPAAARGAGASSPSSSGGNRSKTMGASLRSSSSRAVKKGNAVTIVTRAAVDADKSTAATSLTKPFEVRHASLSATPLIARALYRQGGTPSFRGGEGAIILANQHVVSFFSLYFFSHPKINRRAPC